MKKLILLFLLTPLIASSQSKLQAKKVSQDQIIKSKALKWFKEVYVEANFKDPYSYKVLKSSIVPVNYKEGLKDIIDDLSREIRRSDTTDFTSDYRSKMADYYSSLEVHKRQYRNPDTTSKYYKNSVDYNQRLLKEAKNFATIYTDNIDKKEKLEKEYSQLTPERSLMVFYYIVFIDCYSNNSYGNQVLGRYSLHYNTSGLVRYPVRLN